MARMSRRPHNLVAWLALASYLLMATGGSAVVLCEGSDGHAGIEFVPNGCSCETTAGSCFPAGPAVQTSSSTGCQDTPLTALASFESSLSRDSEAPVHALPPRPVRWEVPTDMAERHLRATDGRTLAPAHLDALRRIVLRV